MSYPNPTSASLTIDVDETISTIRENQAQSATSGSGVKAMALKSAAVEEAVELDIRLYDRFGVLKRQTKAKGGTVEFNVGDLTPGLYILQVYDGSGNPPLAEQIIVE